MRPYSDALTMVSAAWARLPEVARPVQLAQGRVFLEQALERHRVGQLPAPDRLGAALEDPGVHRLEEMLGAQELAHPVIGVVVDQDGAEQRLLGLDVVRLDAEGAGVVGRQGGRLLRDLGWRGL